MFKKVMAGVATFALALGMVAVTATSASAHHNDISAVITCNTSTFTYDVTWSVENSETVDETITASSDTALVPVGTLLTNKQTRTFSETFSAPTNKTLTLSAKWTNNNTNTSSGSIKKNDFPPCTPQHVPVTLCHATPPATAAQGWNVITTDDDGVVKNGHDGHAADIIPSFTYWVQSNGNWTQVTYPGKNLGTTYYGQTGSQILANGCSLNKTATAPVFAPAVCTGPGTWGQGSYTIIATEGVQYSVRINGTGGYVVKPAGTYNYPKGTFIEIKADPSPGWITLTGTKSWSYTVPNPGDCIITVAPVAPDVTNITTCGMYGTVTPKTTTGVVYTFTVGNGVQGAWEITATPASGYKFTGPQSVTFTGNVGTYTKCATPAEPKFEDSECTGPGTESGGSYTIYAAEGVSYQVKIGDDPYAPIEPGTYDVTTFPNTVTIKAIVADGYSFKDYTGPWSHTFESAGECLVKATPVAPAVKEITECGTYGSVTPVPTTGVVYSLTVGDGKQGAYTIHAVPAAGYYFEGPAFVDFSGNLGEYTDCVTAAPATFTDAECVKDGPGESTTGYYSIPEVEGVQYWVSINGSDPVMVETGDHNVSVNDVVVVTATAKTGFTLEGDSEWSHTFADPGKCLVDATPVAPQVKDITQCGIYGSVTPVPATGVVYTLTVGDGMEGAYTLRATPATGYHFAGDVEFIDYSGNLGEYTDCVTPNEVTFTNSECVAELPTDETPEIDLADTASAEFALVGFPVPGYFTIPSTTGVEYSVSINGSAFTVYTAGNYEVNDEDEIVVKATALPGYSLTGTTEWEHTFPPLGICDLPTKAEVLATAYFTNATCTAGGSITVVPAEHVMYYINGTLVTQAVTPEPAGTYVVTAETDAPLDYTIIGTKLWNFVVTTANGCGTVLAHTGSSGSGFLGLGFVGGMLLLAGAGILIRRRNGAISE